MHREMTVEELSKLPNPDSSVKQSRKGDQKDWDAYRDQEKTKLKAALAELDRSVVKGGKE